MKERDFANKIKQDLNYGLGQLPAEVTARLKSAREQAMQAFTARETVGELSMAGHGHGHAQHHHHSHSPAKWLSLTMLLAALAGVWYWQSSMQQEDDIDAALLASDLPLNALVDHDFHSWLDQSSQR